MNALGISVNNVWGRSYAGGYGPVEPEPIGPGLGGFPGITLLGSSVNRSTPTSKGEEEMNVAVSKAESKKRLIRKGYVSSIVGDKGSDPCRSYQPSRGEDAAPQLLIASYCAQVLVVDVQPNV